MTFLEIAQSCIARGWYVFPCKPKEKTPLVRSGFKDASLSSEQIKMWWTMWPNANVAIATGASGLCVVDIDHGLADDIRLSELDLLLHRKGLPPATYAVRTGRRPEFGVQLYYAGRDLKSTGWNDGEIRGDIRCSTGYVMAAGSVHPSGATYDVLWDLPIAPVPDAATRLTIKDEPKDPTVAVANAEADEWKTWLLEFAYHVAVVLTGYEKRVTNGWWLGVECPWAREHASGLGAESSTVLGVLDGKLVFECSRGTCKAAKRDTAAFKKDAEQHGAWLPEPGADPVVRIGTGTGLPVPPAKPETGPVDWRSHWHTADEMENAPELTFLIDGIMHVESITGLAAPAGQRKSLIALNIAHALLTGEPLFGQFSVTEKPKRVLYLCPEMGLRSFRKRARAIGLMPYMGKTFFCRTMNVDDADHPLALDDLTADELDGAVVIVDTAIRYIKGNESDSQDMREFAKTLYRLIPHGDQPGAAAVLVLYHSGKGVVKESNELTLENVLRGSSELGAALTCCWGTKLQELDDPTESIFHAHSYIRCVKPRDFEDEPKAFEVSCDETCKMTYVPNAGVPVLKVRSKGNPGNKDGQDDAAMALIRTNMDLSGTKLVALLLEHGIKRSQSWVNMRKAEIKGSGIKPS